jgi:hypothetical protein
LPEEEGRTKQSSLFSWAKNRRLVMDWKRKLTSRKFWMSVASFVAMLIVFIWKDEQTATQVSALIMAGATVIGYVVGEGLADAGNKEDENEKRN